MVEPFIQIGLEFFDSCVNFLSESDLVELLEHCLVEPFADAVGLRASCFGFRVIDVLNGKVKLVLVMLAVAAVLGPAIGQDA